MLDVILATKLKKDLLKILEEVEKGKSYLVIKKGKPSSILLNVDDYESLVETANLIRDKNFLKKLVNE
jgi:prevent-host-death family protein